MHPKKLKLFFGHLKKKYHLFTSSYYKENRHPCICLRISELGSNLRLTRQKTAVQTLTAWMSSKRGELINPLILSNRMLTSRAAFSLRQLQF